MHRVRVPHQNGSIHLVLQVSEASDATSVDVVAAGDDNEPTSIHELPPRRSSQKSVAPEASSRELLLAPGGRVGKYQLRDKLGQGTFGLVFTAHDTDLDRDVALKVLNPTHATNRDVVQRFLQEARATARIAHPGVVTLLDFGRVPTTFGETAYLTMELLEGESLTSRLSRSGRLAPEAAVEITRQVASALDAAHRVNVLHRDLKPDNIFLVPDPAVPTGERAKVLDFGLAKLGRNGHTTVNTVFGTPRYMSPEQCRSSGQIDQRADVYSLGCILFELITGRTPFDGDLRQLIERHQRATPPRAKSFAPEISTALDDLIARMLEKDPAARPQTMGAVQRELQQVGGVAVGVAATMLPMAAHLVGLGLPVPQGSGPRVFDPADSGAEILVPAQILAAAGPAPRPRAPRKARTGAIVATAVAFLVAALVTAVVMRDGEAAGPTTARPVPAAITTSSLP